MPYPFHPNMGDGSGELAVSTNDSTGRRRLRRVTGLDEREGWKRPPSEDEAPHPYWVDYERHRVVCRGCPWFWARIGATRFELKTMGNRHRANMRQGAA